MTFVNDVKIKHICLEFQKFFNELIQTNNNKRNACDRQIVRIIKCSEKYSKTIIKRFKIEKKNDLDKMYIIIFQLIYRHLKL